jgi:hypothetical protein
MNMVVLHFLSIEYHSCKQKPIRDIVMIMKSCNFTRRIRRGLIAIIDRSCNNADASQSSVRLAYQRVLDDLSHLSDSSNVSERDEACIRVSCVCVSNDAGRSSVSLYVSSEQNDALVWARPPH